MKWENIKHDVGEFYGAYLQVLDCRELGTLFNNVSEWTLEHYKDCDPKQVTFYYLHY